MKPRSDLDVVMIAPKAPGYTVRTEYQAGRGIPDLVAVAHDASGKALANIENGPYAKRFIAEGAAGYPEMTKTRAANAAHPIETVGAELRKNMVHWIAANKIVDKSRN